MRRISTSLAAIIACSRLVQAVSLADFIPLLQGLPPTCDSAYRQAIPDCTANDFSSPYVCSQSCLNGLVQTNGDVTTACHGVSVDPKSIVGLFLLGEGIQALCNVAVVTKTTGGSQPLTPAAPTAGLDTSIIPIIFPTSGVVTVSPGPRPDATSTMTIDSLTTSASNSVSTTTVGASRTSTTLKTSVSSSSKSTAEASASGAAAKQNPAVPDCSNRSSSGSPFDSFTDQQCAKSAASSTSMSPFAAVIGLAYAIILMSR